MASQRPQADLDPSHSFDLAGAGGRGAEHSFPSSSFHGLLGKHEQLLKKHVTQSGEELPQCLGLQGNPPGGGDVWVEQPKVVRVGWMRQRPSRTTGKTEEQVEVQKQEPREVRQ